MTKQLSNCCKAEIRLTGKGRPHCFACEKCGRIIGTPITSIENFFQHFGFTWVEIKDNVFRENDVSVFQTDHKNHTVDASTILYEDAVKIYNSIDTYAMEFLKECLPEKVKEVSTVGGEGGIYEQGGQDGWNACIDELLNNANNKQDNKL